MEPTEMFSSLFGGSNLNMLIAHVELINSSDPSPLQDWIDAHSTAVIERIVVSGFHFYIFYTEA